MKRSAKKTEILQVRVPHGLKRDFMERCRVENRVASDVVRDFLESYLARPVEILNSEKAVMIRKRFVYPTLAAAGVVGAVVAFLPVTGQARTLQEEFAAADTDKDGHLLAAEWEVALKQPDAPAIVLTRQTMTMSRDITKPVPAGEPAKTTRKLMAGDFSRNLVFESDRNGDAKVSFAEYSALRIRMAQEMFLRADKNRDGRMTRSEYVDAITPPAALEGKAKDHLVWKMRATSEKQFDTLDKDGAGYISQEAYVPA